MRLAPPPATWRAGKPSALDVYADTVRALGAGHPLARTQHRIAVAARQAAGVSALLVAAPCAAVLNRDLVVATAAAAALVTAILYGQALALSVRRRTQVHDVILQGRAPAASLVMDEVARLLAPEHRAEVARRLERLLHEAEHWEDYLPSSRPPEGVRQLRPSAWTIHEIVNALQIEGVSARAVIMVERLIQGGYGAEAYRGADWVRRELGRIRFELGAQHPGSAARRV